MNNEEYNKVLITCFEYMYKYIDKMDISDSQKTILRGRLNTVIENRINIDIEGNSVYGAYYPNSKTLEFNAKVYRNQEEAYTYTIHEIKHAMEHYEEKLGFQNLDTDKGVGFNEGVTQLFATNNALKLINKQEQNKIKKSVGVYMETHLDEYHIEAKMCQLFCESLGISENELFEIQSLNMEDKLKEYTEKFDKYADSKKYFLLIDEIYKIRSKTWSNQEKGFLNDDIELSNEDVKKIKELIDTSQKEILKYIESATPERIQELTDKMIPVSENEITDELLIAQEDYLNYQNYVSKKLNINENDILFITGLEHNLYKNLQSIGLTSLGTQEMYFSKSGKILKTNIVFTEDGVACDGEFKEVLGKSLQKIRDSIEYTEVIGNHDKNEVLFYSKEKQDENKRKYIAFLNNKDRIPLIIEKQLSSKNSSDILDLMKTIRENKDDTYTANELNKGIEGNYKIDKFGNVILGEER